MCYHLGMTSPLDIGVSLADTRRALGVSQRELAGRLGLKQPQIARWESTGYRSASLASVDAVSRALGVEVTATSSLLVAETRAAYASAPDDATTGDRALARLGVSAETIAAFCRLHSIRELALFGSSVRTDFGPTSDVDVLVTWKDPTAHDLAERLDIETELRGIFRRDVDLVDRQAVEESENHVRRSRILNGARSVYVAG